jgi:hypothetical protein
MPMRFLLILCVCVLTGCEAGRPGATARVLRPHGPGAATEPTTGWNVAQLYRSSVLLSGRNTAGSGFLFEAPQGVFLVTARHVLLQADGQLLDNRLVVGPQFRPGGAVASPAFTLDLALLRSMGELRAHPQLDAVVVRLARGGRAAASRPEILEGVLAVGAAAIGPWTALPTPEDCLNFAEVQEGAGAMMIGFPVSLTAILTTPGAQADIPLLRRGAVAGRFPGGPLIITDIPSLPGNSGGPVAQQLPGGGDRWKLIGLLSGLLAKQVAVGTNDFEIHTGYSFVVPMDAVRELIRSW